MIDKNLARLRRARQTRLRIRAVGAVRLTVYRTNGHIYAQLTSAAGDKVIASASTLEKDVRSQLKNGGNRKAAEAATARPPRSSASASPPRRRRAASRRLLSTAPAINTMDA